MKANAEWRTVVRFALRGSRFDGSLTISDLPELEAYQQLITETAAAIWRRDHPDRRRLPKGFELASQLRFAVIEKGSSVVPLEAQAVLPPQVALFEEEVGGDAFRAVSGAIDVTWRGIAAASRGERLPGDLPREAIPRLRALGGTLSADERIEITPVGGVDEGLRSPAVMDATVRSAIESEVPGRYEDAILVEGRITAADVTYRRFRVHTRDGREVAADFSPDQESTVTTALRDHDSIAVLVEGRAVFDSSGHPLRIVQIEALRMLAGEEAPASAGDVWASIGTFGRSQSVRGLPRDLASELDRYLYETDE